MLDHISLSIPSSRFSELTAFYTAALAPLGYKIWKEYPGLAVGFGQAKDQVKFWLTAVKDEPKSTTASSSTAISSSTSGATGAGVTRNIRVTLPTHFAFSASDHETVQRFHDEALRTGGECNGKPGYRHMYHAKYFAAFVFDPLGNNVEVVDHAH